MKEGDLLLARMAVNFGHATQAQMDGVLEEVETSGKALTELLLEREICSQDQLQLILSIHGRDLGELVVSEKEDDAGVSQQMFCAYCDTELTIEDYKKGETYQCETCGAMLQKERPAKRISSSRVARNIKITKEMFCPACDEDATIEDYDASKTYKCEACGATMVVDEPEDNDSSAEVPMLQEIGINEEEVRQTSYEHEVAERKQVERRAGLMLTRAREMINIGDYEGAMIDLSAIVEAPLPPADALLLHAKVAIKLADYDAALTSTDKLRKQRERIADAYCLAGQVNYARENYRKATAELDMALEEEPHHVLARLLRGACQHRLRKLTQARQDFEKAIAAARGIEDKLPSESQTMLRQAAEFVETGKLDVFGEVRKQADKGSATEIRHKKKAEQALKAGEDAYLAAREFRLAGNMKEAERLFKLLLEEEPENVGNTLSEGAGKRGFDDIEDYRDLVCHEGLASIYKDGRDIGAAAVHLTKAAFACLRAKAAQERGADNALEAAAMWSSQDNLPEADKSYTVAAKLMGWPDLGIRAWVEELPRENQKAKVKVELINRGRAKALGVRIQVGQYLKPDREMRFGDIPDGERSTKEFAFKALRRGRELQSEFKLFFRDAISDKQLSRVYTFRFFVGAGYDAPKPLTAFWLGEPTAEDAPDEQSEAPSAQPVTGVITKARVAADTPEAPASAVVAASPAMEERLTAIEGKIDALASKLDDLFALLGGGDDDEDEEVVSGDGDDD